MNAALGVVDLSLIVITIPECQTFHFGICYSRKVWSFHIGCYLLWKWISLGFSCFCFVLRAKDGSRKAKGQSTDPWFSQQLSNDFCICSDFSKKDVDRMWTISQKIFSKKKSLGLSFWLLLHWFLLKETEIVTSVFADYCLPSVFNHMGSIHHLASSGFRTREELNSYKVNVLFRLNAFPYERSRNNSRRTVNVMTLPVKRGNVFCFVGSLVSSASSQELCHI